MSSGKSTMSERIGFIGLGIMGKPMARNLLRAGFPMVVHSRSPGPVQELVNEGAVAAASPRDVSSQSDVIVTMLPNSPDVETVALGKNGIHETARSGQLLIDMSTINPLIAKTIGSRLAALGVSMVDGPVSGGEKGAIDGTLSIMAGGSPEDFERALPIFQAMGKTITHLGPLGSGGFTKLANQIVIAGYLATIGEALVFGTKLGVDPEKLIRALSGGMASGKCMEQKAPQMVAGNFNPGFKVDLHYKDLGLVHDVAQAAGVPTPTAALVEQLLASLRARGFGGADHSALVKIFEDLAGISVQTPRTESK
jgi:2-hydroxy-3-oxopropionate reductase